MERDRVTNERIVIFKKYIETVSLSVLNVLHKNTCEHKTHVISKLKVHICVQLFQYRICLTAAKYQV